MGKLKERLIKAHSWDNGRTGHRKERYSFGVLLPLSRFERRSYVFLYDGAMFHVPEPLAVEFLRLKALEAEQSNEVESERSEETESADQHNAE